MVYGIVPVDNMMRRICLLFPLLLVFPAVSEAAQSLRNNITHYLDMKTWKDAQTYCRASHTDLLTITAADVYPHYQGWIGLYRNGSSNVWKWSRSGEEADFTNWVPGDQEDGEHCAFARSYLKRWQSDHCNVSHTVTCYDERLVLVKEKKTWEQALNHCRDLEMVATSYQNHRYDLATLLTEDDHDYARQTATSATTDEVWTGLRYLAGEWLWVGGEAMEYTDVERCPGLRSCGVLVKNGTTLFETRKCDEKRNFLCYKKS